MHSRLKMEKRMLRRSLVVFCTLALLTAAFIPPTAPTIEAQGSSGSIRLITELILPGSNEVKFPHVTANPSQVNVSGNANRRTAFVWTKAATATSFGDPFGLGPAEGQPDYSPTSIALGPDGSVWVAWINQPTRTIFLRQRTPQGEWGPTRIVDRGTPFPVSVEVTVSSTNQIFVAWRDPDTPVRFRTSTDGGVTWSGRTNVTPFAAYASPITLAAGPDGQVGMTFTAGADDQLHIFVGLWNGSQFVISRVTPSGGAGWADSSISFDRQGRVYVAWRGIAESGGSSGVFYAERQPDGSWPRSRLVGGKVTGTVNINADERNNLHVSWIGQPAGGNQLFYAFKPASGNFINPVASAAQGALFNSRAYGSAGASGALNHMVSEEFTGAGLRTRYSLFSSESFAFGGRPVIENDAPRVGRSADRTVLVAFPELQGIPNEIRWRWNAPPTDTANDSNGWRPFTNPMRIPVPPAFYSDVSCLPSRLYTQLRDTRSGVVESEARFDDIVIDGVVEVWVGLENPQARIATADRRGVADDGNAPSGAPNYTRIPLTYLRIIPLTDCSGLTTARIGASADRLTATYTLGENEFATLLPIPELSGSASGPRPIVVEISDGVGNRELFELTVFYDRQKPRLTQQSPYDNLDLRDRIIVTPHSAYDMIQNLRFDNIPIDDDLYPDEIWGVWMANSPVRVTDPLNDPNLIWTVVPVRGVQNGSFTIRNWSLATGLSPEQRVAGEDYYIYIRFLDAAGNVADGYVEVRVESSNMIPPKVHMPLVGR